MQRFNCEGHSACIVDQLRCLSVCYAGKLPGPEVLCCGLDVAQAAITAVSCRK